MDVPEQDKGLAARLREATAAEHKDTESRSFISQLMGGELSLDAYTIYLAQYAYVYRALESRAPQPGDPAILSDPALPRFASIVSDLEHLGATDWERSHPALKATQAYVDHLESIEDSDVPRYLAHHYTRYLGDLSGGQAIAKLVARHYGASDDQLAFYRFELISSAARYKRSYREQVDSLGFADEQEQTLFAEAKLAFGLNGEMFSELGETESGRSVGTTTPGA
ncbi:heme oxygenase (biliverdin-producing) [Demequina flava]|uniref:biliverdin-producing heme oxygenase n=1 Tax=Demequina flava TaxID=1095025 RepID=UPI0007804407|nr:biliverdin-producing heme oxygenase [Demequina flava]